MIPCAGDPWQARPVSPMAPGAAAEALTIVRKRFPAGARDDRSLLGGPRLRLSRGAARLVCLSGNLAGNLQALGRALEHRRTRQKHALVSVEVELSAPNRQGRLRPLTVRVFSVWDGHVFWVWLPDEDRA